MPLHAEPFRVRAYEVDPTGRLALPSLCDWLQEAAGMHAEALGLGVERLRAEGLGWMLHRLRIAIGRLPARGESVTVETWPDGAEGLRAIRHFDVLGTDGEPIAAATSAWLLVDLERRRPARLPAAVLALSAGERPPPLLALPDDIPRLEQPDVSIPFRVGRTDLDLLGHANNVRYLAWALEAVPPGHAGHPCRWLDMQFVAESLHAEVVRSEAAFSGDEVIHHIVGEDGRLRARLRTVWG